MDSLAEACAICRWRLDGLCHTRRPAGHHRLRRCCRALLGPGQGGLRAHLARAHRLGHGPVHDQRRLCCAVCLPRRHCTVRAGHIPGRALSPRTAGILSSCSLPPAHVSWWLRQGIGVLRVHCKDEVLCCLPPWRRCAVRVLLHLSAPLSAALQRCVLRCEVSRGSCHMELGHCLTS